MLSHLLPHLLLLLLLSPLLAGVISRTKAVIARRRGAPLFQLYFDLAKLFRKGMVVSSTTTWVFRAGPVIGLVVPVLASLFIPFGGIRAPISFSGDLVLFVYLFALARFFTVLAALDTGSSFEGMGAAREATFACLAEPTVFVIFIVLARVSGSLSWTPCWAHSRAISLTRLPGYRCFWPRSVSLWCCWPKTRASPLTTPTPIWN